MKRLLLLLLLIPAFLMAQDEQRYLAGAVPTVDGKVVFTKEIKAPSLSEQEIYDVLLDWAGKSFNTPESRVAYASREKGDIAIVGEEYLIFSSTALSLDRSLMSYRMTLMCENQGCRISINGIRYEYNVSYQSAPEKYVAEEWITDKSALSKGKLNRISGKFRRATIDFADNLFKGAEAALGSAVLAVPAAAVAPVAAVAPSASGVIPATPLVPAQPATSLEGYKLVTPDKIPGNIIKMLSEDWMLITAGKGADFNMMTASWGGLGMMFGKPVALCFINPTRHTFGLMEKNDTYTFTFYTEAYRDALKYCGSTSGKNADKVKESGLTPITTPSGSKAFGEAWMVIECKKLLSQPLNNSAITDEALSKEMNGKQLNQLFVGEIINVWIK